MEQTQTNNQIQSDKELESLRDLRLDLLKQRRTRILVMSVLLVALVSTSVFGTLENPLEYTLSNIGNFFSYRWLFIVWAMVTGISIQISVLALFRLEEYYKKISYVYVGISAAMLVLTAIVPALKDIYPFWQIVHTVFSGLHALFLLLAIAPFLKRTSDENPRLKQIINVWLIVIWGGGVLTMLILGKSAIFELWFFIGMILFLLYLLLVLFEEKIVKMSVTYMRDEPDLNLAIEKLFINKRN
ncbi:MAG: hypothetical protein KKE16_00680 [Firmicutes bacterium]|nr:hypothetical protein [Bacillota bacterium]